MKYLKLFSLTILSLFLFNSSESVHAASPYNQKLEIVDVSPEQHPFVHIFLKNYSKDITDFDLRPNNIEIYENGKLQNQEFYKVLSKKTFFGSQQILSQYDVIFVIDDSGSMAKVQKAVLENVGDFAEQNRNSTVQLNLHLIKVGSKDADGKAVLVNDRALNIDEFKRLLGTEFTARGGSEPTFDGVGLAESIPIADNSKRIIFLITDEKGNSNQHFKNEESLLEGIDENTIVHVATKKNLFDHYKFLTNNFNGEMFDIEDDFDDILGDIKDEFKEQILIRYHTEKPYKKENNVEIKIKGYSSNEYTYTNYPKAYFKFSKETEELLNTHLDSKQPFEIKVNVDNAFDNIEIKYKRETAHEYQTEQMEKIGTGNGYSVYSTKIDPEYSRFPAFQFFINISNEERSITYPPNVEFAPFSIGVEEDKLNTGEPNEIVQFSYQPLEKTLTSLKNKILDVNFDKSKNVGKIKILYKLQSERNDKWKEKPIYLNDERNLASGAFLIGTPIQNEYEFVESISDLPKLPFGEKILYYVQVSDETNKIFKNFPQSFEPYEIILNGDPNESISYQEEHAVEIVEGEELDTQKVISEILRVFNKKKKSNIELSHIEDLLQIDYSQKLSWDFFVENIFLIYLHRDFGKNQNIAFSEFKSHVIETITEYNLIQESEFNPEEFYKVISYLESGSGNVKFSQEMIKMRNYYLVN